MLIAQLFCSIIVPTYNHPKQLDICLRALVRQDYPHDRFEVIVVDDGGDFPLESIISEAQGDIGLTLLTQSNAGPATARNTGAAHARGEILVFTDDDCAPEPDWLSHLAAHVARVPGCAIGGRTVNRLATNPYAVASQLFISYLYDYYNADPDQARFFASNNLACPVDRFHALGGFDTSYPGAAGEDRAFCDRWLHHGHRMIYAPDAVVVHAHNLTWRTFWRQHTGYGRGAFLFRRGRARQDRGRLSLENLTFYIRLLVAPYLQKDYSMENQRKSLLTALMFVTQAANACGFFNEMFTHDR